MRLRAFIAFALFAVCSLTVADARPRGGVAAGAVRCAIGNDNGLCAAAPVGGLKQDTNFFTTARQSSQGQYYNSSGVQSSMPIDHDVAGVTYGIGQLTSDAGLIDAKVSPPAGCTWSAASVTLTCANATTDFSGYKLIGGSIKVNGTTLFKATDFHVQATSASCNRFTGLSVIQGGTARLELTNGTFDYDGSDDHGGFTNLANSTCANNARQYKTVGDPGFPSLSSGTATVTGNLLHYTSPPTGTVLLNSYIDCTGCLKPSRIISGSYPDYLIETPTVHDRLQGASISGTTLTYTTYWNGSIFTAGTAPNMQVGDAVTCTGCALGTVLVANLGSNQWQVSISQTVASPGTVGITVPQTVSVATTVTTGPMESTFNAAVAAHGGMLGAKYRYIWSEGYPTFAGETGGGDLDVQANMAIMSGRGAHPLATSTVNDGQHDQFVAWIPAPGSTTTGIQSIQDYNTVLSQAYSDDGIWTSFMSLFSTCSSCSPVANSNYLINFGKVTFNHNVIIGNKALNNPSAAMTFSMWRVLSQGQGVQSGNVTWDLASGVVTIRSVNSGSVGVGDTISCTSFPSCSKAVVLTSQIDATHFNTSNIVDTRTNVTNNVFKYPGQFTLLEAIGNAYDQTGNNGGTYSIDWPNIDIGTFTHTNSWNLLDGTAAN